MTEEHYFATIYMLPNVPGGCNHNLSKNYSIDTAEKSVMVKSFDYGLCGRKNNMSE